MKPRRNISEAMFVGVITLALAVGSSLGEGRFGSQETYLADGQTLTVTQKLGQAVIQFDPAATQNTTPSAFVAPDNTQYVLEVDLTPARGLYTMQTSGTMTESANAAAISGGPG